jgi:hypothetical protein
MNELLRLERWLEQLVEEPFIRLFAGQLLPQDVAQHLVAALEDGECLGPDGRPEVPGRYRIELNGEDLQALKHHHPDLEDQLTRALGSLADRIGVRLMGSVGVVLVQADDLPIRGVRITPAERASCQSGTTLDLQRINDRDDRLASMGQTKAYLIIQGDRTVDLTSDAVTLGRALDNDVILEDRQASRHHARLRQRYGRYILEDLGSTGGTVVNGYPVQEIVLRPGDLISIGGTDLIYAESASGDRTDRGNTLPLRPVSQQA